LPAVTLLTHPPDRLDVPHAESISLDFGRCR
jgi:hypothetical protein